MTADIEVYQPPASVAVPQFTSDIDSWISVASQVIKLANEICNTPFVPDGLRGSAPATAAAILAGREMGLGPMTSLQHIHVIKGKPGLSALLMRALVIAEGHQWEDVDVSDVRAVVRGRRKGESEWTEAQFTATQAKTAGIALGGYPQDKLYARATVRLARRKFADVIMGMPYSAEELEDAPVDVVMAGESYHPLSEAAARPAAIDAPKPKTAQRRKTERGPTPVPSATASEGATRGPAPAATAPSDPGLPPLPGEDETPDPAPGPAPDTASAPPASATEAADPKLVGVIVAHFDRLGYGDEREQRLQATGVIVGRDIASTKELTQAEARAVANTLSRCKDRGRLIELLVDGDKPDSEGP